MMKLETTQSKNISEINESDGEVFSMEVMKDSVGPAPANEICEHSSCSEIGSSQEELVVNVQEVNRYVSKRGSIGVIKSNIPRSVIPRKKSLIATNEVQDDRTGDKTSKIKTKSNSFNGIDKNAGGWMINGMDNWVKSTVSNGMAQQCVSTSQLHLAHQHQTYGSPSSTSKVVDKQLQYFRSLQQQQQGGWQTPIAQNPQHFQHYFPHQHQSTPNRGVMTRPMFELAKHTGVGISDSAASHLGDNCNDISSEILNQYQQVHGPWIKETDANINLHGSDRSLSALKSTEIVPPTTSVSSNTMPTTTIISMTSMSTMMVDSFGTLTSSTLSTVTSMSQHECGSVPAVINDGKRKNASESADATQPKRRNLDEKSSDENDQVPVSGNELLGKLLKELTEIRTVVKTWNKTMEEKMDKIQSDNNSWKEKLIKIQQELDSTKGIVISNQRKIEEEKTERKKECTTILNTVSAVSNRLDLIEAKQETLNEPINDLKKQIEETFGEMEYPVKHTIVAQHVWYEEGENLSEIASEIIHNNLELPNVIIVRCERKSGWDSGHGLIKVEVESEDQLKQVLKNKRKLRKSTNDNMKNIYLRQSKNQEILAIEWNQDLILQEMGIRKNYVRLPSGHLTIKKEQNSGGYHRKQNDNGTGAVHGHASPRGRGQRGRGTGFRSSGSRRGSYDAQDARVAQQDSRETAAKDVQRSTSSNDGNINNTNDN